MITIKKTQHTDGTRAVYQGGTLIATISHDKCTRTNQRPAPWNVCRTSGRVDWFETYARARDDALKG